MKARLTYNLPEEDKEHLRAVRSLDMALALWDIEQYLRGVYKHGGDFNIELARDKFYYILSEYDINLDKLLE